MGLGQARRPIVRSLGRLLDVLAQDGTDHRQHVGGLVTSVAPCLSRPLVPSARGSSGEPGTANTSRPCSFAIRAVISEPERRAASTMTTPTDRPEINRLRRGEGPPPRRPPPRAPGVGGAGG